MPSDRVARPRILSIGFGVYFLLMAIIAWYSGVALGYHYSPEITRWTFTIYLLVGAIFLVGIILAALWSVRYLDGRIEKLEGSADADPDVASDEELVVDAPIPDDVPPPLEEAPAPGGDHVDRDIDELLVSLQEMEQEADSVDETAEAVEPEPVPVTIAKAKPVSILMGSKQLAALRKKRDGIAYYFGGPALAAIGAIGISAAMLPGSNEFLQTSYQLNTALLLGLGYTFVGIAAYVAASILLMTRVK